MYQVKELSLVLQTESSDLDILIDQTHGNHPLRHRSNPACLLQLLGVPVDGQWIY